MSTRSVYIGGIDHCILTCTCLGTGTGHRTATMAASLLLTSGLARYEVGLLSNPFSILYLCEGMHPGYGLD